MGGQTKRQFSAKNDATGQKKYFFRNFIFCYTSIHRDETFFVFIKFSYLQPFREIMGGQGKALHQRQRRRRTNDERTTNYIDDHNTPSGFSESSG